MERVPSLREGVQGKASAALAMEVVARGSNTMEEACRRGDLDLVQELHSQVALTFWSLAGTPCACLTQQLNDRPPPSSSKPTPSASHRCIVSVGLVRERVLVALQGAS